MHTRENFAATGRRRNFRSATSCYFRVYFQNVVGED